jgi:hypothetical protein
MLGGRIFSKFPATLAGKARNNLATVMDGGIFFPTQITEVKPLLNAAPEPKVLTPHMLIHITVLINNNVNFLAHFLDVLLIC